MLQVSKLSLAAATLLALLSHSNAFVSVPTTVSVTGSSKVELAPRHSTMVTSCVPLRAAPTKMLDIGEDLVQAAKARAAKAALARKHNVILGDDLPGNLC